MNCTKCGAPVMPGDNYCQECGTPVNWGETQEEKATQAFQSDEKTMLFEEDTDFSGSFGYGTENQYGTSYSEKKSNGYEIPGGYQDAGYSGKTPNHFDLGNRFDTDQIRSWFAGNRPIWPIVITLLGLILALSKSIIGIIILVAGVAAWVLTWSRQSSVDEVDKAYKYYKNALTKRGYHKLSVLAEQVNIIDPVVLVGCGKNPDSSFEAAANNVNHNSGIYGTISKKGMRKANKKMGVDLDPYVAMRIGKDDVFRTMLVSVSVYMFSNDQVLVYTGNVDISTGLIYSESTDEVFYKDIEGIHFEQNIFKVFSMNQKKFINKVTETLKLYLSGCQLSSNINSSVNDTVLDTKFTAMRNLIRDKNNE